MLPPPVLKEEPARNVP
jgi:hypothetical protein